MRRASQRWFKCTLSTLRPSPRSPPPTCPNVAASPQTLEPVLMPVGSRARAHAACQPLPPAASRQPPPHAASRR